MWIFLGLVSFCGFFAYRLWRKLHWSWAWSGTSVELNKFGVPCKMRHVTEKSGTHRLTYAVTCPGGYYFRFKREGEWDRFAKSNGLSVEAQFADPEFDDAIYVVSNDQRLLADLAKTPELRRVLVLLFRDSNVRHLTCEGSHLSVDLRIKAESLPSTYQTGEAARNIISALDAIARRLRTSAVEGPPRFDRYRLRAIVLVSMASALLGLAAIEVLRLVRIERVSVMVDSAGLFAISLVASLVLVLIWLLIAARLLRGSAHAHLVMLEVLVSGGLGITGSSYAVLRDTNLALDTGSANMVQVGVAAKSISRSRKGGTRYYLSLERSNNLMRRVEVDYSLYQRARPGSHLVLAVRDGYLGYRWIESMHLGEAPPAPVASESHTQAATLPLGRNAAEVAAAKLVPARPYHHIRQAIDRRRPDIGRLVREVQIENPWFAGRIDYQLRVSPDGKATDCLNTASTLYSASVESDILNLICSIDFGRWRGAETPFSGDMTFAAATTTPRPARESATAGDKPTSELPPAASRTGRAAWEWRFREGGG